MQIAGQYEVVMPTGVNLSAPSIMYDKFLNRENVATYCSALQLAQQRGAFANRQSCPPERRRVVVVAGATVQQIQT